METMPEIAAPRVFISYSYDSNEHKLWVREFAAKLRANRVDVILDHWHLKMGMDATKFMTDSVAKSDFVLVVCTPEYVDRSYRKKGGVRFENAIIAAEFVDDMDTERFIPVLRLGGWDVNSVPRWIKTRQGADLTANPYDETQFMNLVATLHGENPAPPPLGTKPDFSKLDLAPASRPEAPATLRDQPFRFGQSVGTRLKEYLAPKEQELLWNAARDSGRITHIKAIGRDCLQVNRHTFPETRDPRSHSEWFGALEALVQRGLLKGVGHDPDFYSLTPGGWSLDEQLGPFKRWQTKAITVERNYIGKHDSEIVTLQCAGIVRLAEEYSEDRYTLYEPHSLFVEGVDRKQLGSLTFDPTHAHFRDEETGVKHEFQIKSEAKREGSTLRMPINEMPGTRYED
ncbi:toll/interleukin-1 receptor domain-containing protein [Acidicapsa ligni]|uniref:toll/interleukin-1 receptor domain-containing protein n=1 Tax=Acidicapsa ligni TaxID=542300 RepID=UPI0021E0144B|nr:toll/interleukin-1 receptor domain-containing protein [Acidicapsa ligni]